MLKPLEDVVLFSLIIKNNGLGFTHLIIQKYLESLNF